MIAIKKIELEKKKLVKNCKKCDGNGCPICFGYCAFVDKMAEAEIPVDYWFRDLKDFYGEVEFKNEIIKYVNNIDEEFDKGLTLCLIGERGKGKTFAACSILKKSILNDYEVYYTTLSDLVSNIIGPNPGLKVILKQYDFVVIDEIDSRFFPTQQSMELFGNQLENVLRSRMQNKLPSVLCSNSMDFSNVFDGEFRKSFESLGSQFIKTLSVAGKDARKSKEKL